MSSCADYEKKVYFYLDPTPYAVPTPHVDCGKKERDYERKKMGEDKKIGYQRGKVEEDKKRERTLTFGWSISSISRNK